MGQKKAFCSIVPTLIVSSKCRNNGQRESNRILIKNAVDCTLGQIRMYIFCPVCRTDLKEELALKCIFFLMPQMEQAFSQFVLCGPSRTSLLTSRLPHQMQVLANRNLNWRQNEKLKEVYSMPQYFKAVMTRHEKNEICCWSVTS